MIVPDANLLIYAHDSSSPFFDEAGQWWRHCMNGSEAVGLCGVVLAAFVRIGTSRSVFRNPMSVDEAAGHVRTWLERSVAEFLMQEEGDLLLAMDMLSHLGSGGNLTTDAQIAAIAHRFNATVHTADTDFQRFRQVDSLNPLLP